MKHPAVRYHGGKFRLAKWIIGHFPEHRIYVEPFGGAANVLLQKERSYSEVYNDLSSDVVNFFQVLRDEASRNKLTELCALTPYSRAEFLHAYDDADEPIELARRFVIRACMGFGSASGSKGASGFRCDSKRAYATPAHLWARFPSNFQSVAERLQGVIIENKNAIDVIKKHDTSETLHYLDPPYLHSTRVMTNRRCDHEMTESEHVELLQLAKQLKGSVVISGYESELYNDLLNGFDKFTKTSRISAYRGTKVKQEVLWVKRCDYAILL
ncbi:DNA adenine methylase [Thorsellia anophelis]|uniref:DNA adenine methylase n=1 Tax=Thorsellia anophelis DSM 18579 TaxID=1123402 RepID=A0A1I0FPR1_9GAMM|nr:DNA adenine methylase [Thorsellia anophelis]SET60097.1 DNA adenine methylase [Thorsellia anophelis DSM 18579]